MSSRSSAHSEPAASAAHHPLSPADTAWLHMDRPTNLMVINSILLFEQPLDWERLIEVVRKRLIAPYPRFRERVVGGRLAVSGPHWEPDPHFDVARHMHRRGLPSPADESALRELASDLAATALDRDKPLWDMYLLDGPDPGCAVIVRMHHCIADGIALAGVLLSLTDPAELSSATEPHADASVESKDATVAGQAPSRTLARTLSTILAPAHGALDALTGAVDTSRSLAGALVHEGTRTLTHPGRLLELTDALGADARSLSKFTFTPRDTHGLLKRELGTQRSVAWSRPLSLERVKAIAHAQDATVNDVLLAAISGALRTYLLEHGEQAHAVRTLVPVNLRPAGAQVPDELGNRFGLVFLTLPVDHASRRERLRELKRRMGEIKRSSDGPVSYAVLEAAGLAPSELERLVIDFFTAKASAVITNVPGPRETVYLAGVPLRTVLIWAPTAGSVGTSVSIFSYDGKITIGLLAHRALIPDPEAIVDRVGREVAAMARLAPAGGRTPEQEPRA